MSLVSREPLDQVLSNYSIRIKCIRNESYKEKKGVWWIQTDEGMKILKKISNSEETFKHILHAIEHLTGNGILIPEIISTVHGNRYVKFDDNCYVLSNAIEGKNPSYNSCHELEKIVRGLAKFHKASEGFSPLPDSKPKCHLGLWVEDYEQQIEDMKRFYSEDAASTGINAVSKTIVNEFPYFYQRAQKAIDGLKGPEYRDWVAEAAVTGCLCHQDFAAGNLIIDSKGRMYVLDTDSLTIDIAARDIRKLLNKIMKKAGKWDMDLTGKILGIYQSENPLTASKWQVVRLDLLFPHLFIGAINKYYYRRDKEWSDEKYLERIREMAAFEKTAIPVLESFHKIIPH